MTHGRPTSGWPKALTTTQPRASAVWPAVPHQATLRPCAGPLRFSSSIAPWLPCGCLEVSKVSAASMTSRNGAPTSLGCVFSSLLQIVEQVLVLQGVVGERPLGHVAQRQLLDVVLILAPRQRRSECGRRDRPSRWRNSSPRACPARPASCRAAGSSGLAPCRRDDAGSAPCGPACVRRTCCSSPFQSGRPE